MTCYTPTLSKQAHTHTHTYFLQESAGCFYLICLLLCVCTSFSFYHPHVPALFLCVTLSVLKYDAIKHNLTVNFSSLLYLPCFPTLHIFILFDLLFPSFSICSQLSVSPSLFASPFISPLLASPLLLLLSLLH